MEWYLKVLKNYANFEGRARRKEYWMFVLFNAIIGFILGLVDGVAFGANELGTFGLIYNLAVLVPTIAVAVRRMHDVGKSGWFMLIPIYNFILAVTEGDSGRNEYGPDPKGAEGGDSNSDLLDDNF